jgi:hypothetical protein
MTAPLSSLVVKYHRSPPDRNIRVRVLVMVLGRKNMVPSGADFVTATGTPVDSAKRSRMPRFVRGVEDCAGTELQVVRILVECHGDQLLSAENACVAPGEWCYDGVAPFPWPIEAGRVAALTKQAARTALPENPKNGCGRWKNTAVYGASQVQSTIFCTLLARTAVYGLTAITRLWKSRLYLWIWGSESIRYKSGCENAWPHALAVGCPRGCQDK